MYGGFFQETSDGNISIGQKPTKSPLETITGTFSFILPILIISTVLLSGHVYLRSLPDSAMISNYQFLCGYINFDTMATNDADRGCKTFTMIQKDFTERKNNLSENIMDLHLEYIPIKASKNLIDASPEKKFIIESFENKIFVDEILKKFESARKNSLYQRSPNIECIGLSITNGNTLSSQCTIYGAEIGSEDGPGKLGSSRIEALKFLNTLSNTPLSSFILMNPPVNLNIELLTETSQERIKNPDFKSRTTIPVQVRYVPFVKKS
jgi:hypothetical protein